MGTTLGTACKSLILYLGTTGNHLFTYTHMRMWAIYISRPRLNVFPLVPWFPPEALRTASDGSDETKGGVSQKTQAGQPPRFQLKRIGPRAILTNLRYRIPYSVRNLAHKSFGVSGGLMVSCHRLPQICMTVATGREVLPLCF